MSLPSTDIKAQMWLNTQAVVAMSIYIHRRFLLSIVLDTALKNVMTKVNLEM